MVEFCKRIQNRRHCLSREITRAHVQAELCEVIETGVLVKVWRLNLNRNEIGDEGCKAIADKLPGSSVTTLNLSYCKIGVEGGKAIGGAFKASHFFTDDFSLGLVAELRSFEADPISPLSATLTPEPGNVSLVSTCVSEPRKFASTRPSKWYPCLKPSL